RALAEHGTVVPYVAPPPDAAPATRHAALIAFLRDIDILWADLYPASGPALQLRRDLGLHCPADRAIWRRLISWSRLREAVVPLAVDETVFHPGGSAARLATRARHSLPPDAPLLLVVGRLNIQK